MKRLLLLAAIATVFSGCAARTQLVTRPPEGLRAIRFLETVRFAGAVGNTWEFPAGTMMVQDRLRESDGTELWCGPMTIRDLATETRQTCMTLNGQNAGLLADYREVGYQRELPPGSTEMTRLR